MRKKIIFICLLVILITCTTGFAAAAPTISFDPATVTLSPGTTKQVTLRMSEAPQGLSGYELTVKYPSSTVSVTDASFPAWASAMNNKYRTSGGYLLTAVDLNKQMQAGSTNIELGTITVTGVASGTAMLSITGIQMNDDNDAVMTPSAGTLQVTVEGSGTTTTATTATPTVTMTTTTTATTTKAATITTTTTVPVSAGTTTAVTSTTVVPAATITVPSVVMVTPALAGSPACGFTANKVAGYEPLEVQFRDLSTGESISGWEWSFGDGGSGMAQSPAYTYRTPGTYTVTLKVTNDLGSTTSTRTGFIQVLGPGEAMPTVTQAAPPVTTAAVEPAHTLPEWTPPEKTAAAATTKAASALPLALAATGIAAAGCVFLRNKGR
jgi:PKD repeat protein